MWRDHSSRDTQSSDSGVASSSLSSLVLPPGTKRRRAPKTPSIGMTSTYKRRLSFEYGTSIEFKLCYCSFVLESQPTVKIAERVANYHDAKVVLNEALAVLNDHYNAGALHGFIDTLQSRLDDVKKNPDFQKCVRHNLQQLQIRPVGALNNVILQQWYDDATIFLNDLSAVTDDLNLRTDLIAARNTVRSIYGELIKVVEDDGLIVEASMNNSSQPEHSSSDSSTDIDATYIADLYDRVASIPQETTEHKIPTQQRFYGIFRLYDALYNAIKMDDALVESSNFTFEDFAYTCYAIAKELKSLLCQSHQGQSVKVQHPETVTDILLQGCRHALISVSRPILEVMLTDVFREYQQVNDTADMSLEHYYAELASFICNLSASPPIGVAEDEWAKYAPCILESDQSQAILNKLQCLYSSFQSRTYGEHEVSRLWLNVWWGLKATYIFVQGHDFKLDKPSFPVEAQFFSTRAVQNQFELVLAGPDALQPTVIENIVAQYCMLIAQSRHSQDTKYNMLKQIQGNVVRERLFEAIHGYAKTCDWNDIAVRSMHKCVVRLNQITDGPAFIRRMNLKGVKFSTGDVSEWSVEKVNPDCVALPSIGAVADPLFTEFWSEARQSQLPVATERDQPREHEAHIAPIRHHHAALTRRHHAAPIGDHHARDETGPLFNDHHQPELQTDDTLNPPTSHVDDDMVDTSMGGMPIISAFDYVTYPFPETRAVEVAQSRQISREMSQAGIHSRGALSEDVVNNPPRHVWPPGTISAWAQPLPIDPLSIISDLWSTWRNGAPRGRTLQQPRPHPFLTSRIPRKEWVDQHPRLRPLLDRQNRVDKPRARNGDTKTVQSHQRHHQHGPVKVPRLRGGGGSGNVDRLSDTASTQLSSQERITRIQQLLTRIRGFWRGGDLPTAQVLQTHFLEPQNWNVEGAYAAIYRLVNSDLNGSANNNNHRQFVRDRLQLNGLVPDDDPFTDRGRIPGQSLNQRSSRDAQARTLSGGATTLNPPLLAQLLPLGGDGSVAPFSPSQIYEDSPARQIPIPQNGSPSQFIPAPNQQHQAQLDRQRANNPAQNQRSGRSNQENQTPSRFTRPQRNRLLPAARPSQVTQSCTNQANVCHPCPVYSGLFHHVCPVTGNDVSVSQPTQLVRDSFLDNVPQDRSQISPSFDRRAFPSQPNTRPSAAGDQENLHPRRGNARGRNQANAVPSHAQPHSDHNSQSSQTEIVIDAGPRNPFTLAPAANNNGTVNGQVGATPTPANTTPTAIAGHNLRNRNILVQLRADRDERDDGFETRSALSTAPAVGPPLPDSLMTAPDATPSNHVVFASTPDTQNSSGLGSTIRRLPSIDLGHRPHVNGTARPDQDRRGSDSGHSEANPADTPSTSTSSTHIYDLDDIVADPTFQPSETLTNGVHPPAQGSTPASRTRARTASAPSPSTPLINGSTSSGTSAPVTLGSRNRRRRAAATNPSTIRRRTPASTPTATRGAARGRARGSARRRGGRNAAT